MKTILYVEDNALVVKAYQSVLEREGYKVEVVPDGLEAMKKLSASKPDVILLDLVMPKISGTDVLKYIRSMADLKTIPVIMLSDCSIADLANGALAIGVEGVLLKSHCTAEILVKAVKDVLNGVKWDVPTGISKA
ncbi:MAG TPA: response regulator [Candidatus Baltobacteraceae bacterium]|nr:response regulator [Candidatus Baltobacteraceae bacterium]